MEVGITQLPRLYEHRTRRGLTQRELAILSGVGRDTIAKLETTPRKATPETARKLARVLKVRPQELM
jgi:transcriptional regulator with XRE-family HTH domain